MDAQRRVTDPTALRALAHPARLAILEQLGLEGPLTATELADRLDESPANCSWHLRKLAEHGFVEEAPGGVGRRRPWQATAEAWSLPETDAPGQAEAAAAVSDLVLQRALDRFRRSHARHSPDDGAHSSLRLTHLWVTAEEAASLDAAVAALLEEFQDRAHDPSARPPGARLVETVMWSAPFDATTPSDGHR